MGFNSLPDLKLTARTFLVSACTTETPIHELGYKSEIFMPMFSLLEQDKNVSTFKVHDFLASSLCCVLTTLKYKSKINNCVVLFDEKRVGE